MRTQTPSPANRHDHRTRTAGYRCATPRLQTWQSAPGTPRQLRLNVWPEVSQDSTLAFSARSSSGVVRPPHPARLGPSSVFSVTPGQQIREAGAGACVRSGRHRPLPVSSRCSRGPPLPRGMSSAPCGSTSRRPGVLILPCKSAVWRMVLDVAKLAPIGAAV